MPTNEGNTSPHLGIGYSAGGQAAGNALFGGFIFPYSTPVDTISIPQTSSIAPTNMGLGSGSFPYQPIEKVYEFDIPAYQGSSEINFTYPTLPLQGQLPPYSKIIVEGIYHSLETTNDAGEDINFFNITFLTNFFPNYPSVSIYNTEVINWSSSSPPNSSQTSVVTPGNIMVNYNNASLEVKSYLNRLNENPTGDITLTSLDGSMSATSTIFGITFYANYGYYIQGSIQTTTTFEDFNTSPTMDAILTLPTITTYSEYWQMTSDVYVGNFNPAVRSKITYVIHDPNNPTSNPYTLYLNHGYFTNPRKLLVHMTFL